MNKVAAKSGRPRGREPGLQPGQYAHGILRDRVNGDRKMNVRDICAELGISAETFYAVVNAKRPVSREVVRAIAAKLGLSDRVVLGEESLPAA